MKKFLLEHFSRNLRDTRHKNATNIKVTVIIEYEGEIDLKSQNLFAIAESAIRQSSFERVVEVIH